MTALFPRKVPLQRVLGSEAGAAFSAIHRAKGVELLAGEQIAAFEETERVETAVTASGVRIPCDFAVAGIGIVPELPAMAGSQVAQDNGVLVDECLRTSAPDVYAAGDVASQLHPPVRLGAGRALQQRGEDGRRGGKIDARLDRTV